MYRIFAVKSVECSSMQPKKIKELTEKKSAKDDKSAFIEMLLNGPVYTEKQIQIIEENTKSIAKWRTKS